MKKAARCGRPSREKPDSCQSCARSALLSEAVSASIAKILLSRCLTKSERHAYKLIKPCPLRHFLYTMLTAACEQEPFTGEGFHARALICNSELSASPAARRKQTRAGVADCSEYSGCRHRPLRDRADFCRNRAAGIGLNPAIIALARPHKEVSLRVSTFFEACRPSVGGIANKATNKSVPIIRINDSHGSLVAGACANEDHLQTVMACFRGSRASYMDQSGVEPAGVRISDFLT